MNISVDLMYFWRLVELVIWRTHSSPPALKSKPKSSTTSGRSGQSEGSMKMSDSGVPMRMNSRTVVLPVLGVSSVFLEGDGGTARALVFCCSEGCFVPVSRISHLSFLDLEFLHLGLVRDLTPLRRRQPNQLLPVL